RLLQECELRLEALACDEWRHLCNRHMHRDESHPKGIAHHQHKAVARAKKLRDEFSVSREREFLTRYGLLINRSGHEGVNNTRLQIFAGATDCFQRRLACFRRWSTRSHFNLVVPTVYYVYVLHGDVAAFFYLVIGKLLQAEQFLIVRQHASVTINHRSKHAQHA